MSPIEIVRYSRGRDLKLIMGLDFSNFNIGDDIEITYTVYRTIGHERDERTTTVTTSIAGFNSADNLEWRAGSTGTGVVRENGHVFDGNGTKIGVDATVEHAD